MNRPERPSSGLIRPQRLLGLRLRRSMTHFRLALQGLAPEAVVFRHAAARWVNDTHVARVPKGSAVSEWMDYEVVKGHQGHRLQPTVLRSLRLLYQATRDDKYRERGWAYLQAVIRHATADGGALAAVEDVQVLPAVHSVRQGSQARVACCLVHPESIEKESAAVYPSEAHCCLPSSAHALGRPWFCRERPEPAFWSAGVKDLWLLFGGDLPLIGDGEAVLTSEGHLTLVAGSALESRLVALAASRPEQFARFRSSLLWSVPCTPRAAKDAVLTASIVRTPRQQLWSHYVRSWSVLLGAGWHECRSEPLAPVHWEPAELSGYLVAKWGPMVQFVRQYRNHTVELTRHRDGAEL